MVDQVDFVVVVEVEDSVAGAVEVAVVLVPVLIAAVVAEDDEDMILAASQVLVP